MADTDEYVCNIFFISSAKRDIGRYVFNAIQANSVPKDNWAIDIDDQLPTYPDGTWMCMSTGAKCILWPSLVEKAVRSSLVLITWY